MCRRLCKGKLASTGFTTEKIISSLKDRNLNDLDLGPPHTEGARNFFWAYERPEWRWKEDVNTADVEHDFRAVPHTML